MVKLSCMWKRNFFFRGCQTISPEYHYSVILLLEFSIKRNSQTTYVRRETPISPQGFGQKTISPQGLRLLSIYVGSLIRRSLFIPAIHNALGMTYAPYESILIYLDR